MLHHCTLFGLRGTIEADLFIWAGGVGVDCFILISGYYMINKRITLAKLLKLWVQVATYSVVLCVIYLFSRAEIEEQEIIPKLVSAFLPVSTRQYWFVTGYMILMAATPFLNKLLHRLSLFGGCLACIGMFVVMSVLNCMPAPVSSLGTLVMFALLYSIAALMQLHGLKICRRRTCIIWMLAMLAAIFTCVQFKWQFAELMSHKTTAIIEVLGFCKKSWPTFIFSVMLFAYFSSVRMGNIGWINRIALCSLGVYLLHTNQYFAEYPWRDVLHLYECSSSSLCVLYCLGACILVYIVCVFVETLRLKTLGRLYNDAEYRWILPLIDTASGYLRKLVRK